MAMQGLAVLIDILVMITQVLVMLIIVQFLIGLAFAFNVVSPSNEFLRQVYDSIDRLLTPVLRPIRNIMPNTGAIDFSPLVLILGLQILIRVLDGIQRSY
ncbi:YggT family protein [Porphyrobacter sp. HT-58-2]|uniref:YggT family protein n=1 Tax=Porphyrobacter sp. HT-58-2 TaxID=2023229 RepID=UPI0026969335